MAHPTVVAPPAEHPLKLRAMLRIFVVLGLITLLAGIVGFESKRVWISYLINFCFWTGVAQGAVVFSAAYRLTNGRWGDTIRRVAEGFVFFLPLSVPLFLVTFIGRQYLWPWIEEPIDAKAAWLNEPFFFVRVTLYFLVMSWLSWKYVSTSIRPDAGVLKEQGFTTSSRWFARLTSNWTDYETAVSTRDEKLKTLVPIILIAYGVIYTFVGFDVVMSLEPHWYSTLYGWLYFAHAFDGAVAGTIIVAILARKYFHLEEHVSTKQFYDVARLLMGLCMLAGGFYWSQYLVTWYGNLEEEIERFILRFDHSPWPAFQWGVIIMLYFFPIAVFLSRAVKENMRTLLIIASMIFTANWFYQFVEIAPSVWHEHSVPLGIVEVGITLGFIGAVGLSWLAYARIVPLVLQADSSGAAKH